MLGDRSEKTGKCLWNKLKDKPMARVMTDYWKAYENIVPKEIHTQSKSETYTIEGYNSLFRHFLARLRRKTTCYTKNVNSLKEAVIMLMLKKIIN